MVFYLKSQTQLEEGHKDPPTLPTAIFKDLPKTKETIEEYIWAFHRVEKSSLGYVIRESIFQPAAITDLEWGAAGSRYDFINDEMIVWMRIIEADLQNPAISIDHYEVSGPFADSYVKDWARFWDLLVAIFSATEAWTMIKTFKVSCSGCGSWLALCSYYLGPNNLDHMASEAEKSLASVHYNRESRNFTFDKFLMHMLKQHSIIKGL